MGRLKGLMLSLLLGLYTSPPTPVEQELHQYLSKTQAADLALCLQHGQHLVVRLVCPCVFLQVLIFFFLGSRAPLHFLSPFPFLSSSAPCLPCSYRRQCRITVRELTVTGSPTAPADSPLLPQSSGPGTGIS